MPVSSSLGLGSGYLNNPVRERIRVFDSTTGSYPTILRSTADTKNKGNSSIAFDDTRTIIFTGSNNISFPTMLATVDNNRHKNDWVATPNTSGSIVTTGSVEPHLSDWGLTFSTNQCQDITPFDESRIYLDTTEFYMTGTKESVLHGFSSRLANKIQIKIPLTTAADKIISRFNSSGMVNETLGTERNTAKDTGFCYYNNVLGRWEDIGMHDPGTGASLNYKMWYKTSGVEWLPGGIGTLDPTTGGNTLKKYQFVMSQHIGHLTNKYDDLVDMGYSKIGAPTVSGGAPHDSTYHATSSHTFKMSDYISHPIIVEKAILSVPVLVRRKNGRLHREDTTKRVDGSVRDIDNYVFFIYRQQRSGGNFVIDSIQDCSGSKRFLMMSASAAFYNGKVFRSTIRNKISTDGLPHTPNFKKILSLDVSGSDSAQGLESSYTGTLTLELTPESSSGQFLGGTRFPIRSSNTLKNAVGSIVIQDFWPGGTTAVSKSLSATSGYASSPADASITNQLGRANTLAGYYNFYNPRLAKPFPDLDISTGTRSKRNFAGFKSTKKNLITYFDASGVPEYPIVVGDERNSTQSPYILFPEDEIIVGIDAGISSTPTSGTDNTYWSKANPELYGYTPNSGINIISGSQMTITAGAASLTIFGSMVKEDKEVLPSLNQPLTSDAIHEALQYDVYDLDQYSIDYREFYTGSYIDNLVFGDITRGDGTTNVFLDNIPNTLVRGAYGSLSKNKKLEDFYYNPPLPLGENLIGQDPYGVRSWNVNLANSARFTSFMTGIKVTDFDERFFDTVMPDLGDYAIRSGLTLARQGTAIKGLLPGTFTETGENKYAFPFDTDVLRKLSDKKELRFEVGTQGAVGSTASTIIGNKYSIFKVVEEETARSAILFRKGYKLGIQVKSGAALNIQYAPFSSSTDLGAQAHGYAYGIQNIRPAYTNAVFRYNKFGQFRDMLEQRYDGKFIVVTNVKTLDSPVQCKFVSADDGSTKADPYQTDSSNLSTECTSSIPYIENISSNTGDTNSIPGMITIEGIGSVDTAPSGLASKQT